MGDSGSYVARNNYRNSTAWTTQSKNESWISLCAVLSPLCGTKKPKYIEAYAFTEDSEDDGGTESSPLMSRDPTEQSSSSIHTHLFTGYLSLFEAIVMVVYLVCLVVFSVIWDESPNSKIFVFHSDKYYTGEKLLSVFCMFHSLLWLIVVLMDRLLQWRHQALRRKGYLKFYRRMKNVRRIPFVIISAGTASMLVFVSMVLYHHTVKNHDMSNILVNNLKAFYIMYAIVGLEMLISVPCLLYYFVQTIIFNFNRSSPDVLQETSIANSPTATLTSVGFRDGEELDELLERQADMIRYLQQHNASLGRRIMELQARTVE